MESKKYNIEWSVYSALHVALPTNFSWQVCNWMHGFHGPSKMRFLIFNLAQIHRFMITKPSTSP